MAPPKEIDPDDAKLHAAGFDPSLPPADAIEKLREIKHRGEISDLAIARALGQVRDPGAAAMLSEIESGAAGALRREVRRSLFRLRQHGIDAPAPAPSSVTTHETQSTLTAMLSPVDSEGARIVWILKHRMQGGMMRLWGLVSEAEGLVGAQNTGLSRRELRTERAQLEERAGMKLVDADWHLADFILCEAYRNTPAARRGVVGNFLTIRAELIAAPPPAEIAHPVYAELAAEAAGAPSLELLREPEMVEWRLEGALIKPYVEEIGRASESVIVLNPLQQQERVNAVIERASVELLAGDSANRIRRRLEDLAYYLARDGRRIQAGWTAAAARLLRDGADLRQHGFFQAFIRTQLGTLAATENQKAEEEPRLIMTPAEAMRAREAGRMRRR